jgi:hypothetical protein
MTRTGPRRPAFHGRLRAGIAVLTALALLPLALALRSTGEPSSAGDLVSTAPVTADPGRSPARTETRTIASRALGRTLPYQVFLPPGYDAEPARRYPVLYMLHGLGGDYTEWVGYGLFEQAERLMRDGAIAPMLIVLPEGDGSTGWTTRTAARAGAPMSRTTSCADRRPLPHAGGPQPPRPGRNSMGARRPAAPSTTGSLRRHRRAQPDAPRRDTMPAYAGDDEHFQARSGDARHRKPEVARTLRLWLDIGGDDYWTGTIARSAQLQGAGVPIGSQSTPVR